MSIHPPRESRLEARFETYQAAEDYLNTFTDYERMVKSVESPDDLFDLSRIQRLLSRAGNPHWDLPGIHLAGTKGKGSTAHFAEAILRAHGLKTGLFTSPHLLKKEERIRVAGGKLLKKEEFLSWMNFLRPFLFELMETSEPPTFFDIITTIGFLQFRSSDVQAAIMEVGLGGRLDSTNVFLPDACILTRLGMDHTEKLGNTLTQIAFEKAGIIKPETPVISHPQEEEARAVLVKRCSEERAPLFWVGEQIRIDEKDCGKQSEFTVTTPSASYSGLTLSVLGRHQRVNAAAAVGASEAFLTKRKDMLPDPELVRKALSETRQPGRIEVLASNPLLVIDGAHNPVAVEVLLNTIREELRFQDLHVLFACSKDKDVRGMVSMLAPVVQRWTMTTFDFPRIEDPQRICAILEEVRPGADSRVTQNPAEAMADVHSRSGPDDCILCCGSFYLVGEIFKQIKHEQQYN